MIRIIVMLTAMLLGSVPLMAYEENFDGFSTGTPLSNVLTFGIQYTALDNNFSVQYIDDGNVSKGKLLLVDNFSDPRGGVRLTFTQPQSYVYLEMMKFLNPDGRAYFDISGYLNDQLVYTVSDRLELGPDEYVFNNVFGVVDRLDIYVNTLFYDQWGIDNLHTQNAIDSSPPYVWLAQGESDSIAIIDAQQQLQIDEIDTDNCTWPLHIAINPTNTKAYVTCNDPQHNETNDTVVVYDTVTRNQTDVINVGASPWGIAITPDGEKAYIANGDDDNVSVLNLADNNVTAKIPVGNEPRQLALSPDGSILYVINRLGYSLSVIDTLTDVVIETIDLDFMPWDVVIDSNGIFAYVSNRTQYTLDGEDDTVAKIQLSDHTLVTDDIYAGASPINYVAGLATTSDSKCLVIANMDADAVNSFNTATLVDNNVTFSGSPAPYEVLIAPNDDYVYVSQGRDTSDAARETISILELAEDCSLTFVKSLTMTTNDGHGMAWQGIPMTQNSGINPALIMYLLD